MEYKQQKYLRQKLDVDNITSNSTFFMILQLKSMNISQWVNLKKELIKYDVKVKSSSVKLLKKKKLFFSKNTLNVESKIFDKSKNLYNGKIAIFYFEDKTFTKVKKFLHFIEKNKFFVNLFIYFKDRFLCITLFKDIINNDIKLKQLKLISIFQSPINVINQPITLVHVTNKIYKNEA